MNQNLKATSLAAQFSRKKQLKPELHWDPSQPGFGIRINRDGTSRYIVKISIKGHQKWLTMGCSSVISYDDAKKLVARMQVLARHGVDPTPLIPQYLKKQFVQPVKLPGIAFSDYAANYIKRYAKLHKKSWKKDEQRINFYLLQQWKDRSLHEITRQDVLRLHETIGKTRPIAANRLLETIHVMWNQAIVMGYLPEDHPNPARFIRRFKQGSRDRFITKSEMAILIPKIMEYPDKTASAVLMTLFATGFRSGEAISLRWDQIDLNEKIIHIAKTKSGRALHQPISSQLLSMLTALPSYGHSKWVFQSKVLRDRHISRTDKIWKNICQSVGINDLNVHDIRRTVGTSIQRQTGDIALVGEVLNQTQQNVTRVYARFDKEHVREALEEHANNLFSYTNQGDRQ